MEFKDYYQIMGLARDATQDDIRRAYRQLARKNHPDVSKAPDAEKRFKEIGEAYAVLKDPEKRAAYDALGSQWREGQDFRPPPDWNTRRPHPRDAEDTADSFDASDFFDTLFRHGFGAGHHDGRQGRFEADGEDQYAKILIDLEDSYTGATHRINLRNTQLDVTIPRGIRAGQHIRLAGRGAPGVGGGKPGDLLLEVAFRPHAHYRVELRDVYLDLPVSPWEAALGAEIRVPTPGGSEVDLKIPKGSAAGRKLRLKGRGIPGNTPGDFYFVLQIALPPADDEATAQIYRDLAAHCKSFQPRVNLGVRQ